MLHPGGFTKSPGPPTEKKRVRSAVGYWLKQSFAPGRGAYGYSREVWNVRLAESSGNQRRTCCCRHCTEIRILRWTVAKIASSPQVSTSDLMAHAVSPHSLGRRISAPFLRGLMGIKPMMMFRFAQLFAGTVVCVLLMSKALHCRIKSRR